MSGRAYDFLVHVSELFDDDGKVTNVGLPFDA